MLYSLGRTSIGTEINQVMQRSLTALSGPPVRSWQPETYNQFTHAAGFVLSVAGAVAMVQAVLHTADPWRITGCAVYVATLMGVYAASTLSHSFEHGPRRDFYRMLDQVCIFLMVVGSFTPFGLVYLRQNGGWVLLAAMWLLALVGIVGRIRNGMRTTSVTAFMLLGWMPVLAIARMHEVGHGIGVALVFAGALAYMVGAWFLVNDERRPYFHATWHIATIAGSACHYVFLYEFVAHFPHA